MPHPGTYHATPMSELLSASTAYCPAVLKGIEEAKAKGDKPHEVHEKAKTLAIQHLKVISHQLSMHGPAVHASSVSLQLI